MPPRNRTRKTNGQAPRPTKGDKAATTAAAFTRTGPLISLDGKDIVITNPTSFPATPIWDVLYRTLGDPHSALTEIDSLRAAKAITDPADPVWEEVHALFGNSHEGLPAAELSPEPESPREHEGVKEIRETEPDDAPADPVQEPETSDTTEPVLGGEAGPDGEVGVAQAEPGGREVAGGDAEVGPGDAGADAGDEGRGHVDLTSRPGTTDAVTATFGAPSPADADTTETTAVPPAGDGVDGNPGG